MKLLNFDSFEGGKPHTIWAFLFGFFVKQAVPIVLSQSTAVIRAAYQISRASSSHITHFWDGLHLFE